MQNSCVATCQMAGQIEELACKKIFGLANKRVNGKAKYFSITKTISYGTPDFFIFCALNQLILFSNLLPELVFKIGCICSDFRNENFSNLQGFSPGPLRFRSAKLPPPPKKNILPATKGLRTALKVLKEEHYKT